MRDLGLAVTDLLGAIYDFTGPLQKVFTIVFAQEEEVLSCLVIFSVEVIAEFFIVAMAGRKSPKCSTKSEFRFETFLKVFSV